MLNTAENTQNFSNGYNDIIHYWLSLRQKLIIDYGEVAGLSNKQKDCLPTEDEFNRFCESLVDYISAGHFKIYDMVMARWKATGFSSNEDIDNLYFKIVATTDPLLNFNDKYSQFSLDGHNSVDFDVDISKVGEIIETRFTYEDELIKLIQESLAIPPGA